MTKQEAEAIITQIWEESAMDDHSGTDKVRDILEAALLEAYKRGVKDGEAKHHDPVRIGP